MASYRERLGNKHPAGQLRVSLIDFLLIIGLALQPVYAWKSGLPQASDIVLASFSLFTFIRYRGFSVPRRILILLSAFILLVIAINSSWALILSDPQMLLASVFYLFNGIIFYSLITYMKHRGSFAVATLLTGIILGLLITSGILGAGINFSSTRQTAGFNNPNQLAYYGVLIVAILAFLREGFNVPHYLYWAVTLLGVVIVLFGASLVGIAAVVVMLVGILAKEMRRPRVLIMVAIAAGTLGIWFLGMPSGEHLVKQIELRQERAGIKLESTVEERGFLRIIEYPLLTVLGAGEGGTQRFRAGLRHELHSSPLTALFSYGVLGFFLYLGMMTFRVRHLPTTLLFVYLGPHIYSFTHQGLRFTLFWVFLALYYQYVTRDQTIVVMEAGCNSGDKTLPEAAI